MSSRKNGPKNSAGARGKKKAREVISRPGDVANIPGAEVVEMLDNDGVSRIKKLTRLHDKLAVDTLAEISADPKAPAGARVTASTRIIEWAHGKPLPIVAKTAGLGTGNGLTITINKFFAQGEPTTPEEVAEIIDV